MARLNSKSYQKKLDESDKDYSLEDIFKLSKNSKSQIFIGITNLGILKVVIFLVSLVI
jgi:hypothetical protein